MVSVLPLASQLFAVSVLLAASGVAIGVDLAVVVESVLWIAGAAMLGAAIGWWTARRSRADALEGSRYIAAVKLRDRTLPSSAGLSGWPLAQVSRSACLTSSASIIPVERRGLDGRTSGF